MKAPEWLLEDVFTLFILSHSPLVHARERNRSEINNLNYYGSNE
jgi:hypothetical protein